MTRRRRPSLASFVSNWRRSRLPLWVRLAVALRHLLRRLAWPPRSCCGQYGQPGC